MTTFATVQRNARAAAMGCYLSASPDATAKLHQALAARNVRLEETATLSLLLCTARVVASADDGMARELRTFEDAMRPAVRVVAAVYAPLARPTIGVAHVQPVVDHFLHHVTDPGLPNLPERVLIWAQHTYRAWRRIRREHRDRRS